MENIINAEYVIRLLFAVALGFSLGLERELTNKYAGLRTPILVCLGACVFTILSIYAFPTYAQGDNIIINNATGIRDTSRVAAQIVTGIGFIGAGTVLRQGLTVTGLTTASTLWIAAAIGMACGAGLFTVGLATTIFAVAVLTLVRIIEKHVLPSGTRTVKRYEITLYCADNDETAIRVFLEKNFAVNSLAIKNSTTQEGQIKVKANVDINKRRKINSLYEDIKAICNVNSISILEVND